MPTQSLASRLAHAPRGPNRVQRIGVWLRAGLGVVVGLLMIEWPYGHACGLSLGVYLGAVLAVVISGAWAGVWSWRYRMATPHGAALAVLLWGSWLAANQVLERVGYAAVNATWRCAG